MNIRDKNWRSNFNAPVPGRPSGSKARSNTQRPAIAKTPSKSKPKPKAEEQPKEEPPKETETVDASPPPVVLKKPE